MFCILEAPIPLSPVTAYLHYVLVIPDYPDTVSIVFDLYKNRFLLQMVFIFKGKPLYSRVQTTCVFMLKAPLPLSLNTVYLHYVLGV